jgi:hypothetical protein
LGVKLWGNLDCRTVDALLLEVAEAHGTARNEAPVFGREAGIALSLAVSSGDPRRERIGITEAARSLELNDKQGPGKVDQGRAEGSLSVWDGSQLGPFRRVTSTDATKLR